MLRSIANQVKESVSAARAGQAMRRRAEREQLSGWVDLAFDFRYRSLVHPWPFSPINVRPLQVRSELRGVAEFLADKKIRRVLEIGTSAGGTLFVWTWIAGPGGFSVSLDLPEGEHAGAQPLGNEGYPSWRGSLYRSFVPPGHPVHLLKGDSHSPEMLARVEEIRAGEPFDFLFIDGDHSFDGVRKDFEMYSPLVRSGGYVAFHDIVVRPPETKCEVQRFWAEVRDQHPSREFIEDPDQGWGGIGILTL